MAAGWPRRGALALPSGAPPRCGSLNMHSTAVDTAQALLERGAVDNIDFPHSIVLANGRPASQALAIDNRARDHTLTIVGKALYGGSCGLASATTPLSPGRKCEAKRLAFACPPGSSRAARGKNAIAAAGRSGPNCPAPHRRVDRECGRCREKRMDSGGGRGNSCKTAWGAKGDW